MAVKLQTVNVSGTKFQLCEELWVKLKKKIPCCNQRKVFTVNDEVFAARDARAFQAILYEQLGGELHIPSDMCPSVLRKELEFWGIEETMLAKCCFVKYTAYFEDQEALKILEDDERRKTEDRATLECMSYQPGWRGMQGKMWLILNEPFHSNYSRAYFVLHVLLITISIFALVAGTHHSFQRHLTLDEWREYFGADWNIYKHRFYETISTEPATANTEQSDANPMPEEVSTPEAETEPEVEVEAETEVMSEVEAEPQVNDTVAAETEPSSESNTTSEPEMSTNAAQGVTGTATPEAEPDTGSTPGSDDAGGTEEPATPGNCEPEVSAVEEPEPLPLPENTRARFNFLDIIEFTSIAFFTLDLIVRVIVCPFRVKLLYSFLHWVDVFALTVMYAKYIVEALNPKEKYEASVVDILHCLQVVRILQMFRLVESSVAFRVLLFAFKASFIELMHMSLFLFVAMLFFSTCVYFSGDLSFSNIPDAFWWSLITMTTVGYGDMVPKEPLSRLVGVICSITGVCIIAVIIPIFVNNFVLFYSYSKVWSTKAESDNSKHTKPQKRVKISQVVALDTVSVSPDKKAFQ